LPSAGHALYEQGRNLEYDGLPVNSAMSMGVHESQSLLWERMVGLSKPFAGYLLPQIREAFPEARELCMGHGSLRSLTLSLLRHLAACVAQTVPVLPSKCKCKCKQTQAMHTLLPLYGHASAGALDVGLTAPW